MCHKYCILCNFNQLPGNFIKPGGIGNHFIGNAGDLADMVWDFTFGIDQSRKFIYYFFPVMNQYSNFGNFISPWISAGCLDVNNGIHSTGKNSAISFTRFTGLLTILGKAIRLKAIRLVNALMKFRHSVVLPNLGTANVEHRRIQEPQNRISAEHYKPLAAKIDLIVRKISFMSVRIDQFST